MKCSKCGFEFEYVRIRNCKTATGRETILDYIPKFCPECGTKIDKEPVFPWWCVPGMTVKNSDGDIFTITEEENGHVELSFYDNALVENKIRFQSYIPCGGPFDMIPEWAKEVYFFECGESLFLDDTHECRNAIWNNRPLDSNGNFVWADKTFLIDWR